MVTRSGLGLFLLISLGSAGVGYADAKISCAEVQTTEAKCQEYDKETAACDGLIGDAIKAKVDAAKHELDECKKKHGVSSLLKCKKEQKEVTTLQNTPKQLAGKDIAKELTAKADTPCAKAEAIGKEQMVCKGPKKVLDTMKANCIK